MTHKVIYKRIPYKEMSEADAVKYLTMLHKKHGLAYGYIADRLGVAKATLTRWRKPGGCSISPQKQVALWDLLEELLGISGRLPDDPPDPQ